MRLFDGEDITFAVREDLSVFMLRIFETLFTEICTSENSSFEYYRINISTKYPTQGWHWYCHQHYNIIDFINNEKKTCLLMGDLKDNSHTKTNDVVDSFLAQVFYPKFVKPTRITQYTVTFTQMTFYQNQLLA